MLEAEKIMIESDERGFELHVLDDVGEWHYFNIHSCAEQLYDTVKASIGPWLAEADSARMLVRAGLGPNGEPCEDGLELGETAYDYYKRTGDDGPLRDLADHVRKLMRESIG